MLPEAFDDGARQRLQPRPIGERLALQAFEGLLQYRAGPVIHRAQAQLLVQYQHAGRQIGEDVLQISLGRFEFGAARFGHAARIVELLGHAVERLGEYAQFIAAGDLRAAAVIAARHRLGARGEQGQWLRQARGEQEGERGRGEQRQQQRQRQREDVDFLQALARQRQLLVVAIHLLHRLRIPRQRRRHRLQQLQQTFVLGDAERGYRNQHAQAQAPVGRALERRVRPALPRLALDGAAGEVGHEFAHALARAGDDIAAGGQEQRIVDARLFAQAVKQHHLLRRRLVGKFERHAAPLVLELGEQQFERGAAEVEPALERVIDAHVEPGFDAFCHELQRHHVDEASGDDHHGQEHQQKAQRQARAEHARAQLGREHPQLVADQGQQRRGQRRVQAKQQRVMAGEHGGVAARRRQQEQQDRAQRHAAYEQVFHWGAFSVTGALILNGQRRHSEARFHSRLVSALT